VSPRLVDLGVGIRSAAKVTVLPTNTEHLCMLCKPGKIGRLEALYRKGYVGLGILMRDVELIAHHNRAFSSGPGVSLRKAGDPA
jgi:hypothetical protein